WSRGRTAPGRRDRRYRRRARPASRGRSPAARFRCGCSGGSWLSLLLGYGQSAQSAAVITRVIAVALGLGAGDVAVAAGMCGDRARPRGRTGHAADPASQAGEMAAVAHTQLEGEHRGVGTLLVDGNVIDVGLGAGDRRRYRREHAGAVDDVHADLGGEYPVGRGLPAHRQPLLRVLAVVLDVDAVLEEDVHAAPCLQECEYRIEV